MFSIELYLKFLRNSISGKCKSERSTQLSAEKEKIAKIIKSVDNCFYGDHSLLDQTDNSIYAYIKKEIIRKIWANADRIDEVIFESKFYLGSVLSEIDSLDVMCVV